LEFYERGCQEKKLPLIWQPGISPDSQPRVVNLGHALRLSDLALRHWHKETMNSSCRFSLLVHAP